MFAGVGALDHDLSLAKESRTIKVADDHIGFNRRPGQCGHRGVGEQQPQAKGEARGPGPEHHRDGQDGIAAQGEEVVVGSYPLDTQYLGRISAPTTGSAGPGHDQREVGAVGVPEGVGDVQLSR